ncbi:MAG TPA: ABC transporter permease [Ardenticatenaceae bacterium]|nr:ABC transporter permease [Ardenticatenaceae bacterium]
MQRYLLSRFVQSILILVGVLLLVFFMIRLTGDPTSTMISREASPEAVEAFRREMGFDRPVAVQFTDYVKGALGGDFGDSLHYKKPALELILGRLPATVHLAGMALLIAVAIAIPLGLLGGSRPGSLWDSIARTLGLFGQTIPSFWLALILIIVFAVKLGWFPTFGRDELKSVVLPAFALGLGPMGQLVRLTRSSVLEIRSEDYIRTANGKGLPRRMVYTKHVLRNAAIPLISVIGVQFGYLLGGSIYIETIFSWPGLGRMLAEAVAGRDFPLVQAIAFFTSLVVVAINLLTDLAYSVVDPRIHYGS